MAGDDAQGGTDEGRPAEGDVEIERLLREGAGLLAAGQGGEAFDRAREALRLRPSHPLASNLLGLALLEQGRHTEAREVFDGLTRRNPDVVPLRVNAGLAALGEGDLDAALDQFRRAIDLDPAHGRAFGYLALVHLRLGEPGFARAALREAGLEALADQIGDGDPDAVLSALESGVKALPASLSAAAPHEGFAESGAIPAAALNPDEGDATEAAEAAVELDDALDLALGEAQQRQRQKAPTREMPEVTRKLVIPRGTLPAAEPRARALTLTNPAAEIEVQEPTIAVRLNTSATQDGAVVREDSLVLQRGEIVWQEVERRRKGKRAGPFSVDETRMMRAEGEGLIVLHAGAGRRLHLFRLEESGLYLREQGLLVFADRLYWENGRIPRIGEEGPQMVTLRGSGFAAVRLRGELFSARTRKSEVTAVRLDHLLGWSPDAVPVSVSGDPGRLLVGFQGAGVVWLDLPSR